MRANFNSVYSSTNQQMKHIQMCEEKNNRKTEKGNSVINLFKGHFELRKKDERCSAK